MIHLVGSNIIAITADSEDPEFPAIRTLDYHPGRPYKAVAGQNVATLIAEIINGCSHIILAGTNASDAVVTVSDPNATEWGYGSDWGYGSAWGNNEVSVTASVLQMNKTEALLLTLSATVTVPCEAAITCFAAGGETLKIGVIAAKIAELYNGKAPKYGLKLGRIDNCLKGSNSNSSPYYKYDPTKILRTFDIEMILPDEAGERLLDNYDAIGQNPSGWKLTSKEGTEMVVFGKFASEPEVSLNDLGLREARFRIEEVR